MNEGEGAGELRELPDPLGLEVNGWAEGLNERGPDDLTEGLGFRESFLLKEGPDRSLSVARDGGESSASPRLLPPAELDARLREDELALISLSFSFFSSNPIKIRERASLYAASRSSIVMRFCLVLPPVALLRPPILPASEGSISDESASSPVTEPA